MTPGARLAAAIEVLADIGERRRPAPDALKDWGLSHRFAGSGDRAAIAGLVYDTLRRRASSAFMMDDDSPRVRALCSYCMFVARYIGRACAVHVRGRSLRAIRRLRRATF